jgi:hypothetical protein
VFRSPIRPCMPTYSAATHGRSDHAVKRRKRSEFVTTETELNAMAAPASIGLSMIPTNGYRNRCRRARVILGDHHRVEAMVWSTSLKPFITHPTHLDTSSRLPKKPQMRRNRR